MAILIVFASLFATANRPPADAVLVHGSYYHAANVSLQHCTMPVGNSTPWQSIELAGVNFSMHVISCYSPGGLALAGNATRSGASNWTFQVSDRQLPDAEGLITQISPDGALGIRYSGSSAYPLVRV